MEKQQGELARPERDKAHEENICIVAKQAYLVHLMAISSAIDRGCAPIVTFPQVALSLSHVVPSSSGPTAETRDHAAPILGIDQAFVGSLVGTCSTVASTFSVINSFTPLRKKMATRARMTKGMMLDQASRYA